MRWRNLARACHVTCQWGFIFQADFECSLTQRFREFQLIKFHTFFKKQSSMKGSKRVSKQALEGANVGLQTSATRSHSEPDAVTIHSECAAYPPLPSTSTTRSKFCLIHHRSILHHGPVQSPSPAFSVDRQLCLIPRVREVEFVTKQLVIDLGAKKT